VTEFIRFLIRYVGRFLSFFLITAFLLYEAITYFPNRLMIIYWIALFLLVLLLIYSMYLFKKSTR